MFAYKFLQGHIFSFHGHIPKRRLDKSFGTSMYVNLLRNWNTIFQCGCIILKSHQNCLRLQFLYIFINSFIILLYYYYYYCHPGGCKVVFHAVFICISLMNSDGYLILGKYSWYKYYISLMSNLIFFIYLGITCLFNPLLLSAVSMVYHRILPLFSALVTSRTAMPFDY